MKTMKKILVVDDDADILSLVEMMLTMNDYQVEAITKWEYINTRIAEFVPDLILLDISLIGADGRHLCKTIKEQKDTQHIPVVLFSANPEFGNNYQQWLAEDFLEKPFEFSQLLKTIGAHVN